MRYEFSPMRNRYILHFKAANICTYRPVCILHNNTIHVYVTVSCKTCACLGCSERLGKFLSISFATFDFIKIILADFIERQVTFLRTYLRPPFGHNTKKRQFHLENMCWSRLITKCLNHSYMTLRNGVEWARINKSKLLEKKLTSTFLAIFTAHCELSKDKKG